MDNNFDAAPELCLDPSSLTTPPLLDNAEDGHGGPKRRPVKWINVETRIPLERINALVEKNQPLYKRATTTAKKGAITKITYSCVRDYPHCPFKARVTFASGVDLDTGAYTFETWSQHDHKVYTDPKRGLPYRAKNHLTNALANNKDISPFMLTASLKEFLAETNTPLQYIMDVDIANKVANFKRNWTRQKAGPSIKTSNDLKAGDVDQLKVIVANHQYQANQSLDLPVILQTPDEALWYDKTLGKWTVNITLIVPSLLDSLIQPHIFSLGIDETYNTNLEGLINMVCGMETQQKNYIPAFTHWVLSAKASCFEETLRLVDEFCIDVLEKSLFRYTKTIQSDHDNTTRAGVRLFFKDEDRVLLEAGSFVSNAGVFHDAFEENDLEGWTQVEKQEEVEPRIILFGECKIHVIRRMKEGKTAWMNDISSDDRKEMVITLEEIAKMSAMEDVRLAMDLFADEWEMEYPKQIEEFRETPYFRGSFTLAFLGPHNNQNGLEGHNRWLKKRRCELANMNGPLPLIKDVAAAVKLAAATLGEYKEYGRHPIHALDPVICTLATTDRIRKHHKEAHMLLAKIKESRITCFPLADDVSVNAEEVGRKALMIRVRTAEASLHSRGEKWSQDVEEIKILTNELPLEPPLKSSGAHGKNMKKKLAALFKLEIEINALSTLHDELYDCLNHMDDADNQNAAVIFKRFAFPSIDTMKRLLLGGNLEEGLLQKLVESWALPLEEGETCSSYIARKGMFVMLTEDPMAGEKTLHYKCTCSQYLKYNVCSHSIAFSQKAETNAYEPDPRFVFAGLRKGGTKSSKGSYKSGVELARIQQFAVEKVAISPMKCAIGVHGVGNEPRRSSRGIAMRGLASDSENDSDIPASKPKNKKKKNNNNKKNKINKDTRTTKKSKKN
jgi:hypothetical protein